MWPFRAQTIAGEVKRRQIARLLHSTQLYINLPRILETGWIQTAGDLRRELGMEKASRYLHDPRRYEQFAVGLDYLNFSLSGPNYELLYHRSKANWQAEWVHLELKSSLLERESTKYCAVSAAKHFGSHVGAGVTAFRAMFADEIEGWTRAGLRKWEPTHPQAEVLIAGALPLSDVNRILVPTEFVAQEVQRLVERHSRTTEIEIAPPLFVWPERLVKH